MREWLPSLSCRKKWHIEQQEFKVGDVVLAISTDTPRGQWPLARVVETIQGQDGHVRVLKLLIGKTVITRPISKVCRLEVN